MAKILLTRDDIEAMVQDSYGEGEIRWLRGGRMQLIVHQRPEPVSAIGFAVDDEPEPQKGESEHGRRNQRRR